MRCAPERADQLVEATPDHGHARHSADVRIPVSLLLESLRLTASSVCVATGIQMHYVNIAISSPDRTCKIYPPTHLRTRHGINHT